MLSKVCSICQRCSQCLHNWVFKKYLECVQRITLLFPFKLCSTNPSGSCNARKLPKVRVAYACILAVKEAHAYTAIYTCLERCRMISWQGSNR